MPLAKTTESNKYVESNSITLTSKMDTIESKLFTNKKIKYIYDVSRMGYSGPNVKKVNQDNLFIFNNFNDTPNSIFMAVCDGHGMYGHDVSNYLKENLPISLNNEFKNKSKLKEGKFNVNKSIEDVFQSNNSRLFNQATIDTNFSGSTCVSVIYYEDKLICANVGDSRAILGRFVNGSKFLYKFRMVKSQFEQRPQTQ
jgi:serine/threonine protein phosphatase PrpC